MFPVLRIINTLLVTKEREKKEQGIRRRKMENNALFMGKQRDPYVDINFIWKQVHAHGFMW